MLHHHYGMSDASAWMLSACVTLQGQSQALSKYPRALLTGPDLDRPGMSDLSLSIIPVSNCDAYRTAFAQTLPDHCTQAMQSAHGGNQCSPQPVPGTIQSRRSQKAEA